MNETKIFLSFYLFPKRQKDFSDFLVFYLIFMLAHQNSCLSIPKVISLLKPLENHLKSELWFLGGLWAGRFP